MKCSRKLAALVTAAALSCSLAAPVFAYTPEMKETADKLYAAGLFSGYGADSSGQPVYGLDDGSTRAQAVAMLVRMLGVTNPKSPAAPFTDVPAWAAPAVNYAYEHQLTSGVGDQLFGSDSSVTAQQYTTFCLRALEYGGDDFHYADAIPFARQLGILAPDAYADPAAAFTRGDMVLITYAALNTRMKGSSETLAQHLGVVIPEQPDVNPVPPENPSLQPGELPLPSINPNVDSKTVGLDYDAPVNKPLTNQETGEPVFRLTAINKPVVLENIPNYSYNPNKSSDENFEDMVEKLHAIDPGIDISRENGWEYLTSGGWGIDVLRHKRDSGISLGSNRTFYFHDENDSYSYNQRNLMLNAMAYYDQTMARQVDSLIYDYYHDSNSSPTHFTTEQLEKNGLTLVKNEINPDCDTYFSTTITNGTQTWELLMDNMFYQFTGWNTSSFKVHIYMK